MNRFFKFALTGVVGTFLDFMVFMISLELTDHATISRATGYTIGTLWAFFLNRSWVFQSGSGISRLAPFVLLYLTSGAIAIGIQWVFSAGQARNNEMLWAYALSFVIASTMNFLGMRYLVFGNPDANNEHDIASSNH